jgi:hypothetical protein
MDRFSAETQKQRAHRGDNGLAAIKNLAATGVVSSHAPALPSRKLHISDEVDLDALRSIFGLTEGCKMQQAWLAKPEVNFSPATVKIGWLENSLLVFACFEGKDTYSNATNHNQRMWELGNTFEMFLSAENSSSYVELHITPNNWRLQLCFPDAATSRRARKENQFNHLILPEGTFYSKTWVEPENGRWHAFAKIPSAVVGLEHISEQSKWCFSFCRFDRLRGRQEPVISSTSAHAQPDFHRREEWGTLVFV